MPDREADKLAMELLDTATTCKRLARAMREAREDDGSLLLPADKAQAIIDSYDSIAFMLGSIASSFMKSPAKTVKPA